MSASSPADRSPENRSPTDTGPDVVHTAVDTDSYPLAEPDSERYAAVVAQARRDLQDTGCAVLSGFVRQAHAEALRAECAALAPLAHYEVETVNVYNTALTDTTLPETHPARRPLRRGNAFVARDRIPAGAIISRLYTSAPFREFLAACLQRPAVYELADPLAGLCLNIVRPGHEHPWHFDTNEFAVSMLTQESESGGEFEFCPNIRTARAENFADVAAVLDGAGEHLVRRRRLRPGDLQLFRGRYSLHRVNTVRGGTPRHTAIFAYSERPGVLGAATRTRQLFGRLAPEHTAARTVRIDELLD